MLPVKPLTPTDASAITELPFALNNKSKSLTTNKFEFTKCESLDSAKTESITY